MKWSSRLIAAGVACVPSVAMSAVVQFAAPAGDLPVGRIGSGIYDAVLPSGRLVTPLGENVVSGAGAFGFALSPDGRFAIVSNGDERATLTRSAVDPRVLDGSSIAVIDTATLRVVDRFAFPGEVYSGGVRVVADPRFPARTLIFATGRPGPTVYVCDLDTAGHITPDARHAIALPSVASDRHDPILLSGSGDGRHLYAVDQAADRVVTIDVADRAVGGQDRSVGFAPFGAAVAGDRLLVSNEGVMSYAAVTPAPVPPFLTPPTDIERASSLSIVALTAGGDVARDTANDSAIPLDIVPDGRRLVGGAHPTAIAVTPDAGYAFVAMTNVDRIATVRLGAVPQVAGGTELRLFDRGPYGTQPAALALSHDGTRLYVALAGLDAVAVLDARDPIHLHRLGLIPTGWFPSALALSPDDRSLYVLNTKGFGRDRVSASAPAGAADPLWSTLQKIDLANVTLSVATSTTLKNTRRLRTAAPTYPHALRNVVVILQEAKTFDAALGDLGYGPADPARVRFGAAITPNLHALARRYAVAGNFFADAQRSGVAHEVLAGGTATVFSERSSIGDATQDPEKYPRAGYVYNALARHHITFRDYGDLLCVAGYVAAPAADPLATGPDGLGGSFRSNMPAPAILAGRVDLNYPGWNPHISDERRAREFVRDYARLVAAQRQPRFTQIWLPGNRGVAGPDLPPVTEQVADGDRALGTIVAFLSRLRSWRETVVFVLAADTQNGEDHVDADRSYALVVGPFAKQHYVGVHHTSTASVLKTSEGILHVPALALGDLLAADMSDYIGPAVDVAPYSALMVPTQLAGAPGLLTGTLGLVPNPTATPKP